MILLAGGVAWWQSFPWAAVGATGVVFGFIVAAIRIAMVVAAGQQKNLEQDRRLDKLEGKAEGVPDEVKQEISVQTAAATSADAQLRRNVTRLSVGQRRLAHQVGALVTRCSDKHGPLSRVVDVDDVSDELLLEEPKKEDDSAA